MLFIIYRLKTPGFQQEKIQFLKLKMIGMPAAENFVTAVNNALELICSHPARWPNKYKDYHERSLKKYPFTLIKMDMDKELQLFYLVIITKILKKI